MFRRHGLTLLEVLIALLILGVVAVLAIPRPGAAAIAPSPDHLLRADLQVLRIAIARYYQDHGLYPGQSGDGQHPARSSAAVISQLTQCSNALGHVAPARDPEHCYGPYLRDGVPPGRIPPSLGRRGVRVVWAGKPPDDAAPEDAAWLYNCDTGHIAANSSVADAAGQAYDLY